MEVGQHHIKAHESVSFISKGVASNDTEIFYPVQEKVHAGDGRSKQVALLPEQAQVAPFFILPAKVCHCGKEHAGGPADGVVNRLFRLRFQHFRH